MPEFNIEISLTKVLTVEADNLQDAIRNTTESFIDGDIDTWDFDLKIGKAFSKFPRHTDHNPVITQEELDTCDGGIEHIKPTKVEVSRTKEHLTSDIIEEYKDE